MGNTCGCADKSDMDQEVRVDPKKFGDEKYGVYRDSRLAGDSKKGNNFDPTQFHFLDNPHLANLE
jgi:hypothetical protein